MAEIIFFVALPFDFIDGAIAPGEPVDCPSPAAAIRRAQGLWKVFGHAGSVAFTRSRGRSVVVLYNRTRRHSAIGYISPIEMKLKAA